MARIDSAVPHTERQDEECSGHRSDAHERAQTRSLPVPIQTLQLGLEVEATEPGAVRDSPETRGSRPPRQRLAILVRFRSFPDDGFYPGPEQHLGHSRASVA